MFHCSMSPSLVADENNVIALFYQNYTISQHTHDFYEINIVMSGSGIHQIADFEVSVHTGDVFVIPPGVIHGYTNTIDLDVFHLLLNPKFINDISVENKSVNGFDILFEIEPFLRNYGNDFLFLHLSSNELIFLRPQLEALLPNGIYDFDNASVLRKHEALKIIYWFSHLLEKQVYHDEATLLTKNEKAVILVLDYIHKHFNQKITLDMLCEISYLSRSTLIRSFKAVCNTSPMQYLQDYRCQMANRLLKEGRISQTDVAHECGFYDLAHMKKYLKQFESMQ